MTVEQYESDGAASPILDNMGSYEDKVPLLGDAVTVPEPRHKARRRLTAWTIAVVAGASLLALCGLSATCYKNRLAAQGAVQSAAEVPESELVTLSSAERLGDEGRWLGSNRKFNLDDPPMTRYFDWEITEVMAAPGAINKHMLAINGLSPGPILEANFGDKIVINVHNKLKHDSTSIHWHGMWQRGTNFMDGTMSLNGCGIPPGKNATYIWYAQNMGTAWYHSHRGMQYTDGMYGPIILHSPNELAHRLNQYDDELTLMIGDLYNTRSSKLPVFTTGRRPVDPSPDGALINGHSQAKCAFLYPTKGNPGTNWCGKESTDFYEVDLVGGNTYRIRLVNTGSLVPLTFSIDNHTFHVIEADGTSIKPYAATTLSLDVGHRYSILVKLDQKPGAYWIRNKLETEALIFKGPFFNETTLGVLRYKGHKGMPANIPGPDVADGKADAGPNTNFPSAVPLEAPLSTVQYTIEYGPGMDSSGDIGMMFNSHKWKPLPDGESAVYKINASNADDTDAINKVIGSQYNVVSHDITAVDLVFNAPKDIGTHPFHLHGHSFWIMSQGKGAFNGDSTKLNRTDPMRRDTFVVPPHGHAVIRYIADNPGVWPLHCHIAWHLEAGLLMTVTDLPHEIIKLDIPKGTRQLCYREHQG